jgi:hypothetical protein
VRGQEPRYSAPQLAVRRTRAIEIGIAHSWSVAQGRLKDLLQSHVALVRIAHVWRIFAALRTNVNRERVTIY